MDHHKNYKGSYIFSEVNSKLSKEGNSKGINSFPNLDFLERKNSTLNSLGNIDFYCLIDMQKDGQIIFEKDISLNIGLETNSVGDIVHRTSDEEVRIDQEMDKTFTEFYIHHQMEPMDMVLSNVNRIVNDNGEVYFLERIISILSNDENGIPLFGFCAISKIEMEEKDFNIRNFNIHFAKGNQEMQKELAQLIKEQIA